MWRENYSGMDNFSAIEMAAIVAQQSRLAAVSARAMLRSAWQRSLPPQAHNPTGATPQGNATPDFSEQFLSLAVAELRKYNRATLVDGAAKLVLFCIRYMLDRDDTCCAVCSGALKTLA
jgi:hypothetical protein